MKTQMTIPRGKRRSIVKKACLIFMIIAMLVINLALPADAAISTGSSTTATSGTGLSVTLNKPAGAVAGDVLVACIVATSALARRAEVTAPAGWQLIRHTYATQNWYYEMLTYYKVAGTSEPANYIWTSTEFNLSGGMTRLIGVDVNHVVDVSAEAQGQGDSPATVTAPSVTTTYANDIVIHFFGTYSPLTSPYFTEQLLGGMEPLYEYAPQKTGAYAPPNLAAYYRTIASAGSVAGRNCTLTATTSPIQWVAQTVAFKAAPRAYFPVASSSAAEADTSHWVGVNLAPNAEGPVEVNFTVSGTAQPGVDYTLATPSPLTVNTGSGSASIGINIIEDSLYEADETIIITLESGQEYFLSGSTQYTYTITNDDFPVPGSVITTGTSRTSITPTDISLQVLQIPNPGAVAGDFLLAAITRQGSSYSQTITPPAGWTLIRETHRTNSQGLNLVTYYKIAGSSEPSMYNWGIPDDHSILGYHASGGITRYTGVDIVQPIDVSNAAVGTMPAGATGTVTVPSVYPSYANGHIVSVIGIYNPVTSVSTPSGMAERYEIKHSIAPYNSMTLLWPTTQLCDMTWAPATGTGVKTASVERFLISENTDWAAQTIALKTSQLSISDVSFTEGNSSSANAVVTVSLDHPTNVPVTFNWLTADGTAVAHYPNIAGDDYMVSGGTGYTIPAGQTSYELIIPIIGDTTLEPNETFYINLTGVTGATVVDSQAMVTILDNDSNITINDVSQNEGNSGTTNFNFTVTLSPACSVPVSVTYFTPSEGTATQGIDYTYTPGTVEIPAGKTTATISIPVIGDTDFEPNETFVVYLSGATNARISDDRGIGTILNDDIQIPTMSINDVSLAEGNSGTSNMVFTVTLDVASASAVTVNYTTVNGTATAASDYTATSGTLTIPAGQKSGTITVPIIGDTAFEPNETFYVNLSSPANATLLDHQGQGTINNDDVIHASINDVTQAEGSSGSNAFVFTVTLDSASSSTVTIDFATADGTAFAGLDYSGYAAETLTFSPGVTSKTITVQVSGDTIYESDETFYVNLSNASGAVIADAQGVGTILNDDAMPTYALTMDASPAGSGTATDQTGSSPYTAGTIVNISATPASGYHFVNWTASAGSLADANAASTSFTVPEQAVTVTANFAPDTFTVSFDSQGGSAVSDQTVVAGEQVVKPDNPTRSDYIFVGWYRDILYTDDWNFDIDRVTADMTLYARWAALDQQMIATSLSLYTFNGTYAQTFTAGMTGKLYRVSCYLGNYNTEITLTTQIQGVTAGDLPNGTVLAGRSVNLLAWQGRWVSINLEEPLSITAGQRYAIVWSGLNSQCLLYGSLSDTYADGRALMMISPSWGTTGLADFAFRTYVLTSPGITLTPAEGLVTTETGGTDTFTVVLDSQPAADVTVTLSSSDVTEGTVAPASLTFTASNWNTPQTVTVTGVDDALTDGDIAYTVSATASSADLSYHDLMASASVTNTDVEGIAPEVAADPINQTITYGNNASFTASATGTPAPTVQWQISTDGGSSFTNISNGGVYSGATTTTLSLTQPPVAYSGYQYRAVFTNGFAPDATTSAATLTVNKLAITGSFSAADKVYDGSTAAAVTGRKLTGVLAGDTVSLSGGTAAFSDKHAGTGKTVTLSGASLTGTDAGNYSLTSVATATADITPKPVAPAIVADDKTYDGDTEATLSSQSVSGVISPDVVTLIVGDADFADEDVGTWTVTATTLSLGGADAANYTLSSATATDTAQITAKNLTISGAVAMDKVYDGTIAAGVDFGGASLVGVIGSDKVSIDTSGGSAAFNNKQVGSDKPVTVMGIALSGTDAANYTVSQPVGLTADITRLAITGSFSAADKVYDGSTATAVTGRKLTGVLAGDTVSLSGGTAAFSDKHAGTGKTVTLSGASLTGTDAGNYSLTSVATATADITVRSIVITAVADTKTYDGTTASDGLPAISSAAGLATGDSAEWFQTFDTKDAGTNKVLTPDGTVNDGNGGANYQVTFVTINTGVIEKAMLTVTAENKTSQYSDPRIPFTVVWSGFIPGETLATSGVTGFPDFITAPYLSDPVTQAPGLYAIVPSLGSLDANNYKFSYVSGIYTVTKENAVITFDAQNPVSVKVMASGEGNAAFTWQARISQTNDGNLGDLACIDKSNITLTFSAVGSGGSWSCTATDFNPETGIATFAVPADVLNVETYAARVSVLSSCYLVSPAEDVLVIYDPSLGFTTGGGWFYWPAGTANPELAGVKTNFGFTMKYNKKGTGVQGSLLLIAHLDDGSIIRIKSNAVYGLAIIKNTYPGIASFSGKCVYSRVDADGNVLVEAGNQDFTVYVQDMDEPGTGTDLFWFNTNLTIAGEDPFSLDSNGDARVDDLEYVPLGGGNIVVPHKASSADYEEEPTPPARPKKK